MKISGAEDPHKAQFSQGVWIKDTWLRIYCCCSLSKSCPTLCGTHGLQHTRLSCRELVMQSNHFILSCSLLLMPSIFLRIRVFSNKWFFASGGQSSGASASASVLPMNIQGSFLLELTCLITLQSKGLSRVFSSTTIWKHQFLGSQPSLRSNSHICIWLLEKP